jgi:hypothetical protein
MAKLEYGLWFRHDGSEYISICNGRDKGTTCLDLQTFEYCALLDTVFESPDLEILGPELTIAKINAFCNDLLRSNQLFQLGELEKHYDPLVVSLIVPLFSNIGQLGVKNVSKLRQYLIKYKDLRLNYRSYAGKYVHNLAWLEDELLIKHWISTVSAGELLGFNQASIGDNMAHHGFTVSDNQLLPRFKAGEINWQQFLYGDMSNALLK